MSLGTLKPSELWGNLGNRRISSQVGPPCWLEQSVECVYLFQWISFIVFLAGITSSSGLTIHSPCSPPSRLGSGHPQNWSGLTMIVISKDDGDMTLLGRRASDEMIDSPISHWKFSCGCQQNPDHIYPTILWLHNSFLGCPYVNMMTPITHHPRPIFDNLINPRFVPGD